MFLQSAVDSAVSSTPDDLREHTESISVRSVQDAKGGTHPSSAAHTASLSAASARLAAGGGCGGGDSEPSAAVAGGVAPSVTPITPPWPTRIREFVSFCSSASYTVESHKTSAAANTDGWLYRTSSLEMSDSSVIGWLPLPPGERLDEPKPPAPKFGREQRADFVTMR
eukprot:COSAG04_NODE_3274_length_2989_cov_3.437370_3_plen_168_part_00